MATFCVDFTSQEHIKTGPGHVGATFYAIFTSQGNIETGTKPFPLVGVEPTQW